MAPQAQQNRKVKDRWSGYSQSQMPYCRSRGVHRDYGAHFFRWSAVQRLIKQGETHILDIGCGQNLPIANMCNGPFRNPASYTGVDLNPIPVESRPGNHWFTVHDETNVLKWTPPRSYDLVTCFEVIEHMEKADGKKLIKRLIRWSGDTGTVLLSTPVFIKTKAADHIYEWSREEIIQAIRSSGGIIENVFGTFARIPQLKKVLTPEERRLFNRLASYYDHDALSLIFAPLHPRVSSNNIWVVRSRESHHYHDARGGGEALQTELL